MLTDNQRYHYKQSMIREISMLGLLIFLMSLFMLNPVMAYAEQYTCPMHPHYIADEPGSCPICGMDLVALEVEEEEPPPKVNSADTYTCPMHPHYIANEPGMCPICGMDLVLMEKEDAASDQKNDPNTRKAITIPPETIQNIGVRTEPAEIAHFGKNIRSFGLVSENMRLTQAITGRVAGWVEQLSITAVGDEVSKGDLIFTLYSPDLISAQQDYLAALSTNNKGRIRSSAQRLVSMGVGEKVLASLKKKREKLEKVPFYSSSKGVVSHLMISEGSYIKPGSSIATVQSYQSVWVNVSVAEKDLQFIQKDTKATVTFPNLGNTELIAHVDYIYPTIEESSRTGKVRLVLDNDEGLLKPGAYADIIFETQIDKRLSIPSEAILRSAEGDYVVVAKGEGRFQPQRVKTGIRSQGRTEIIQGLSEGEAVLVSSQFLIDSESSLRESFRKLQLVQTPLSLLEVSRDQLAMIDHLVDAALYLHKAQITGFEPKSHMIKPALQLNQHLLPVFRGTKLQFVLEEAERALQEAQAAITETERLRAMAALVEALKPWVLEGNPAHYKGKGLRLYVDHGTGYLWLQLEENMRHPYGQGHAVEIEIPSETAMNANKESAEAPEVTQPVGGAHAHH